MQAAGSTDRVIENYFSGFAGSAASAIIHYPEQSKTTFHIERIEILDQNGDLKQKIYTWDAVRFRIVFHSPRAVKIGSVVFQISTTSGSRLLLASTEPDQSVPISFREGNNIVDCFIPQLMLTAGKYQLGASLAIPNIEYLCEGLDHALIEVEAKDVFNSGLSPNSTRSLIPMDCRWQIVKAGV